MQSQPLSLLELNQQIQFQLHTEFSDAFWLTAEISEMRVNRNGHCYLELIEKSGNNERIVAKMRGIIWAYTCRLLRPFFEEATGRPLEAGIKVLIKTELQFHELYGLSLKITDIDPAFTLGDMARQKQQVLNQLKAEGILELNRSLSLPPVVQQVAVISSATAAGYEDFMNQLQQNEYGYQVMAHLFPAYMQGNETESSVIDALGRILDVEQAFDAVVLIRGGGSRADLSDFDQYNLAAHLAQFPLPIITGIGHEKDESVADQVAHTALKTPTAVAEFLLDRMQSFESDIIQMRDQTIHLARKFLQTNEQALTIARQQIVQVSQKKLHRNNQQLGRVQQRLQKATQAALFNQHQRLANLLFVIRRQSEQRLVREKMQLRYLHNHGVQAVRYNLQNRARELSWARKRLHLSDPARLMAKGYVYVKQEGQLVKSIHDVASGNTLTTHLADGTVESQVNQITPKKEETNTRSE